MRDYDGLDIELLTDSRGLGESGSALRVRSIKLNGQEIAALQGAEFSLHGMLGKPGTIEATFTVLVKSVDFKDFDAP
jgi:hypothetical protein